MARLLFAVHGMGEHDAGWAASVLDTLNAAALPFGFFDSRPPPFVFADPDAGGLDPGPDRVAVVPIGYDGVFETWRQQLGASVEELRAFVRAGEIGLPDAGSVLLNWLDTAPEDERRYFWSHGLDVLLYRYTRKAGEVRLRVVQQLAQALTRAQQGGRIVQASVVAHSLGTAVAHDSLAVLGTEPFGNPPSRAFCQPRLFHSVWMLANVSRVLQSDRDVYGGIVRPITAGTGAYTDAYVTVRHALDPIPAVLPFARDDWGDGYADLRLHHVRDFNVHGFEHYLAAPQVHVPLLNNLFGGVIENGEYEAAVARDAAQTGPPCIEQVGQFVQRAGELVALFQNRSVVELAVALSQFLALSKRMRAACAGAVAGLALLACALPAGAQPSLRADCDAQVVAAMDRTTLPDPWAQQHPDAVFDGYAADMAAGRWVAVFRAERARFAAASDAVEPEARAAFLRQADSLVAEAERVFAHPDSALLVATARGVRATRFGLRAPSGLGGANTYTLFPQTPDAIAIDAEMPQPQRRVLCWSALALSRLLTAYGAQGRALALEALDGLARQWDAFNSNGYSMYPWELVANSLGRARTSLAPPRRQFVLLHPSAGVGVAGWPPSEWQRLDVLALEVAGLLVYAPSRRNYRGASLLVTLPSEGGPGGGALVHLCRTLRAGYVFRLAASDVAQSGGLVFSLDLYKALTGVPQRLQDLRARVERVRVEVGQ